MDALRTIVLVLAVVSVGITTGVMFLYANTLMPGLGRTDDRTFVGAFQAIDTRIINPIFLGTFFGGLILTAVSAALHLGDEFSSVLPWLFVATALYFVVVILTAAVNVPLNDAIKAAGKPDGIDVHQVRVDFNEARWIRSNLVRALLTLGAFASLAWALIQHGRATG